MAKIRNFLEQPPAVAADMVTVRVTKMGDGRVSNGVHHTSLGDEYFETGEMPSFPLDIATELESRGLVEIQEPGKKAA